MRPERSRRSAKDAQCFLMGDEGRPIQDRPFVRLFLFWEKPVFISADSLLARTARHTIVTYEALSLASGSCVPFPDPASREIRSAVLYGLLLLTVLFPASSAADCIPLLKRAST
jgi:hypothetical protein